jgi:iron complex outermembrane receptor protein
VSNVTLTTVGANVTQQRQNLGRTRIHGLQTDVQYTLGGGFRFTGGYLFNVAKVTKFDANPALVGNDLPQVPRNRGSFGIDYSNPRYLNVSFGLQAVGDQFDDDQNTPSRVLPGFSVLSLSASRRLTRNLEVFAGVQNLTDEVYYVGTLPTTLGTPRLVNGGIRVRFVGR